MERRFAAVTLRVLLYQVIVLVLLLGAGEALAQGCPGYACECPRLDATVSPVDADGNFVLHLTGLGAGQPRIYWRGSAWIPSYQTAEESTHILSTACLVGSAELRVVPLNCWFDEYLPNEFRTMMTGVATQPSIQITTTKAFDPAYNRMRRKVTVVWDFGHPTTGRDASVVSLPWRRANGSIDPGVQYWPPYGVTLPRTGTDAFFFDPPGDAQQFVLRASATSCTGTATADVSVDCSPCDGTASQDPVNFNDGNVTVSDGEPLPLVAGHGFSRTYNSDERTASHFGRGWTTLFDQRFMSSSDGGQTVVTIVSQTNAVVTFRGASGLFSQTWPQARSSNAVLSYDGGAGTYSYRAAGSSEQLIFRASDGRLLRLRDVTTGRTAEVTYGADGLPASFLDSWTGLGWTLSGANGRITSIAVVSRPDLIWTYSYDANGDLQSVIAPGGAPWRQYLSQGTGGRLSASYDAAGNLIESHQYDVHGRGIDSTGPNDEIANIQYDLTGGSPAETITRVTMKTGQTIDYRLQPSGGALRTVSSTGACGTCGHDESTFARDAYGRVVREQNAAGYVTSRTYTGGQLASEQRHQRIAGCDPEVDSQRCRVPAATLTNAVLEPTPATVTVEYIRTDALWPDRVTQTSVSSVVATAGVKSTAYTFHPSHGSVVSAVVSGWTGSPPVAEQHVTTRTYYGDIPPCDSQGGGCTAADAWKPAFTPGGNFNSSWMLLPQPAGALRTVDGPRVDVADITAYVYYPVDASVPQAARGKLAAVRNANGHITRFESYDVFGNVLERVDASGVRVTATFDQLGRPLTSTLKAVSGCDLTMDPLCGTDLTSTTSYSPASGPIHREQRPSGAITEYSYDLRGRIATISRGPAIGDLREQKELEYDAATGKVSRERLLARANGSWVEKHRVTMAFDVEGRLSSRTNADGTAVHYAYDPAGRLQSLRDENHAAENTKYRYDAGGRLSVVDQAWAGAGSGWITTTYAYDKHGNLQSVTDPNGNVTSYVHDDFGRMRSQQSPVTGTTSYAYDLGANLLSTTDANGATTARVYDVLGRVTSAVSSRTGMASETVTWSYDTGPFGTGRLSAMTDPSGTTTYGYDRRGLLLQETTSERTTRYRYDADGNRSRITYPSGREAVYEHDYAGRPTSVAVDASPIVVAAAYLPYGPADSISFGNGTVQTMEFDSRYRLVTNKLRTATHETLAWDSYGYDPAGNITSIADLTDSTYSRSFGYDGLNRLVTATGHWGGGGYSYDAMGNMLTQQLGASMTTFTYSGTTPKLATETYDASGNLLGGQTISPRNQVVMFSQQGSSAAMAYDGRGVRVQTIVNNYPGPSASFEHVYTPELRALARYDTERSSGWPIVDYHRATEFVWLGSRPVAQITSGDVEDTTVRFTFTDHLETPLLQTDPDGNIIWRVNPTPYGESFPRRDLPDDEPVNGFYFDEQPLRFPGQEQAPGDTYNIFRWYRARWGRYTQADPIGLSGGLNNYMYANMSPIQDHDPFGLYVIERAVEEIPMGYIRATCPGLGSACTLGYRAVMMCDCECDGSVAVTLKISGRMYVYPGNPRALGNARPFDQNVRDAASAVAHEWEWHLDAGIRVVDPFIREFERRAPFSSQEECGQTCGEYAAWVNSEFAYAVALTQTLERRRQDPRDVQ
jgi:RHS repeat-associated protein